MKTYKETPRNIIVDKLDTIEPYEMPIDDLIEKLAQTKRDYIDSYSLIRVSLDDSEFNQDDPYPNGMAFYVHGSREENDSEYETRLLKEKKEFEHQLELAQKREIKETARLAKVKTDLEKQLARINKSLAKR